MPVLSVNMPNGAVESVALGTGQVRVGLNPERKIFLDTPFVSRRHAVVTPTGNAYSIRDLLARTKPSSVGRQQE